MPFLAALAGQGKHRELSAAVNRIVTRIFAFAFLLSAWMIGMAHPLVDLILRGGSFRHADVNRTALYFMLFAGSLCFWAAQAIYARAFYASGNTLTPMTASTVITLLSIGLYWFLFHRLGVVGLAIASDCGILVQTLALAILLHRKRLVSGDGLEYSELVRALGAAVAAFLALYEAGRVMPPAGSFPHDALQLLCGSAAWFGTAWLVLHVTGSKLPQQLTRRFRRRKAEIIPSEIL